MRSFDASLPINSKGSSVVRNYHERKGYGESFAYEAEYLSPTHVQDIWVAIQQIEHFHEWFFGRPSRNDDTSDQLPDVYGRGQVTPGRYGSGATIVECSLSDGFLFRHNDAFFSLRLIDYGPAATRMILRCFDFNGRPLGILSRAIASFAKNEERDQSADIESTRRRLVRLSHLADDLKRYGQPMNEATIDGRTARWVIWYTTTPGTLHFLPDERGVTRLESGRACRAGKLGYVIPDHLKDSGESVNHFIERWYVDVSRDGVIKEVKKNSGDRVEPGDRLFLFHEND